MILSPHGKPQYLVIILSAAALTATFIFIKLWWLAIPVCLFALALLAFFRDPERTVPVRRNIMVAPADGKISSIHEVEKFELFGEGAVCIRIFLSVLDVHINRSPCHGVVGPNIKKPGKYLNALKPESAEENEWCTFPLLHPAKKTPVAAVRQVSGMIARTIVCAAQEGQTLQRGERFGMIKFGSTTEIYVPKSFQPKLLVEKGQYVWGGVTEMMEVNPPHEAAVVGTYTAGEKPAA
jgi:phosphatidylserine decarboxylase